MVKKIEEKDEQEFIDAVKLDMIALIQGYFLSYEGEEEFPGKVMAGFVSGVVCGYVNNGYSQENVYGLVKRAAKELSEEMSK